MKILGIETSCDETGVCIIETKESTTGVTLTVLGNQLYSQVAKHQEFGGVMPTLAKREHAKNLVPLLEKCLEEANMLVDSNKYPVDSIKPPKIQSTIYNLQFTESILSREPELFIELKKLLKKIEKPDIDAIAVTNGPGLEPALWVGVTFAQALSVAWDIPIIATNHMEGHIVAALLQKVDSSKYPVDSIKPPKIQSTVYNLRSTKYPTLALLISGGHTQLVLIKNNLQYEIIGNTCDDAVGEAFDKVARMLSLPYPGGKIISDLAKKEKTEFPDKKPPYPLPRPMIHSQDLNFSFSGLKTAVLYTLKKLPEITDQIRQEISLEFENAVIDVLIGKVSRAVEEYNPQTLIIGGGVSADPMIRIGLEKVCQKYGLEFLVPEVSASTDNALMIALAGYMNIQAGKKSTLDFKANGNLSL
jgi:N6-L-threonylcarbamoyladenine synthase